MRTRTNASDFWLTRDYFPELITLDRRIMPTLPQLRGELGECAAAPVPVPHDCVDGFLGAYWRRPHAYLDASVRSAISTFSKIHALEAGLTRLRRDLQDGTWERRYGDLLGRREIDLGYRLLVSGGGRPQG